MAHLYRPSGLPWTSKSIALEPKLFIKIKPLAIQSQKGYKIITRSEQKYSCADRPRNEVFKDNYLRRQHQVRKCGYWSDVSKPYKPVGDVELDTRTLLLRTLDQQDQYIQENHKSSSKHEENRRTQKRRERKSFKFKNEAVKQEPYCRTAEQIIKRELSDGRNRMAVVRSGSDFFQVIESEQKLKEDALNAEKQPTYSVENWRPATNMALSDTESEDDETDPLSQSPSNGLNWDDRQTPAKQDYWTQFGIPPSPAPPVDGRQSSRKGSSKSRRSIAPQNLYFPSGSTSAVRTQLQILRWFLEAMRSDTPAAMIPITSAWAFKASDTASTLESKKITQARWKSFTKNKSPGTRPKSAATVAATQGSKLSDTSDKEDQMSDQGDVDQTKRPGDQTKKVAEQFKKVGDQTKRATDQFKKVGDQTKRIADQFKKVGDQTKRALDQTNRAATAKPNVPPATPKIKRPSTSPGCINGNTLSPVIMRNKFCLVAESKAEALTQQLKAMERSRSTACRKKFTSLELTGVLNKDLYDMRASVALDIEDTARRKILYNFHWFDDLLAELPFARDEPKYLSTLQKLYALSQSQQAAKRFTRDRFLAVLLTLREWEISLSLVSSVIRFIRDRVIFLPEVEYNEWLQQCYTKS